MQQEVRNSFLMRESADLVDIKMGDLITEENAWPPMKRQTSMAFVLDRCLLSFLSDKASSTP